jgi:formylmethanofuran dehydrogenase subunit E
LCETLLPLDPTVFTPTTFRHTKRLPIKISNPSHKKFHFKKVRGGYPFPEGDCAKTICAKCGQGKTKIDLFRDFLQKSHTSKL